MGVIEEFAMKNSLIHFFLFVYASDLFTHTHTTVFYPVSCEETKKIN